MMNDQIANASELTGLDLTKFILSRILKDQNTMIV